MSWLRISRYISRILALNAVADPNDRTPQRGAVSSELFGNLSTLREVFSHTPDLIVCEFFYKQAGQQAALVYFSGLSDKNAINNNLLRPLMFHTVSDEQNLPVTAGAHRTLVDWLDIEHAVLLIYRGCCPS
ncbi:spore germination protein [Paenibacillus sp. YYML68]|uniref:spore germination protein n=1 Tax=Paenibacillus sp. YYML68 TaxID=2909250 RepID=UPI002492BDF0|nr:spore germination protein [Paenibacillus sp. YYML68]